MLVWNDNTMFAVIINVGVLSLLLYVAFGPVDGNPIGLGLLAVAVVPIAGMGILIGVVKLLIRYFGNGADNVQNVRGSRYSVRAIRRFYRQCLCKIRHLQPHS